MSLVSRFNQTQQTAGLSNTFYGRAFLKRDRGNESTGGEVMQKPGTEKRGAASTDGAGKGEAVGERDGKKTRKDRPKEDERSDDVSSEGDQSADFNHEGGGGVGGEDDWEDEAEDKGLQEGEQKEKREDLEVDDKEKEEEERAQIEDGDGEGGRGEGDKKMDKDEENGQVDGVDRRDGQAKDEEESEGPDGEEGQETEEEEEGFEKVAPRGRGKPRSAKSKQTAGKAEKQIPGFAWSDLTPKERERLISRVKSKHGCDLVISQQGGGEWYVCPKCTAKLKKASEEAAEANMQDGGEEEDEENSVGDTGKKGLEEEDLERRAGKLKTWAVTRDRKGKKKNETVEHFTLKVTCSRNSSKVRNCKFSISTSTSALEETKWPADKED